MANWWSDWLRRPWGRILKRAASQFRADHVSIVASGVAFRATLAIFPAVAVLVWIGSRFVGADAVQAAIRSVTAPLPDSARAIIGQAMSSHLASEPGGGEGVGLLGRTVPYAGLLFALWSANSGVKALFVALNTIFDRTERRGFLRLFAITLAFTGGTLLLGVVVTGLIVAAPFLRSLSGVSDAWLIASRYLRWPILYGLVAAALGILYRYAPNRERDRWPFVTTGGLGAALILVCGSAAFSWVVDRFASLSVTYGSLSTFIAFMLLLWLSFAVVLAGAELDAGIDRESGRRLRQDPQDGAASSFDGKMQP